MSLMARQVSVGCHHVRQARRTATNLHQELEHAGLVDNAEPDRKPVKALEDWSDVIPSSCSCNKSGRRIMNTLKWINRTIVGGLRGLSFSSLA